MNFLSIFSSLYENKWLFYGTIVLVIVMGGYIIYTTMFNKSSVSNNQLENVNYPSLSDTKDANLTPQTPTTPEKKTNVDSKQTETQIAEHLPPVEIQSELGDSELADFQPFDSENSRDNSKKEENNDDNQSRQDSDVITENSICDTDTVSSIDEISQILDEDEDKEKDENSASQEIDFECHQLASSDRITKTDENWHIDVDNDSVVEEPRSSSSRPVDDNNEKVDENDNQSIPSILSTSSTTSSNKLALKPKKYSHPDIDNDNSTNNRKIKLLPLKKK